MLKRTFLDENQRPDVLFVRPSADVVRTSSSVRVYPADALLPADAALLSADAVKNRVRTDAVVRPRGRRTCVART